MKLVSPKMGFPEHTTSEIPQALLTDYGGPGEVCGQNIICLHLLRASGVNPTGRLPITCGNYGYIQNSNQTTSRRNRLGTALPRA